jgi:hypothetical protein
MSTYLENYGKGEEKRQRLVKSASIFVLLVLICTGLGWYILHNRKEDAAVSNFVELLRKKDYPTAYAMWGCTVEKPCRDYDYKRFLEDWSAGPHADAAAIKIEKTRSCTGGLIRKLRYPADEVLIFVSRSDLQMSFPPWGDACEVRLRAPAP